MKYLILCLLLSGCYARTTIAPEWIQTYPRQVYATQQVEQKVVGEPFPVWQQQIAEQRALIAEQRALIKLQEQIYQNQILREQKEQ